MPASVTLRTDFSAEDLRRRAKSAATVSQGPRLLSLAAVLDGMSRADAARVGGMDRQTLRDWVHRFNEAGPVATRYDRCAHTFFSAICIAAAVAFYLNQ
jgi:hypothetical protein